MLKITLICFDQPRAIVIDMPFALLLIDKGEGFLRIKGHRVDLLQERVFLLKKDIALYFEGNILIGHLLEFQQSLLDYFLLQNIAHRDKGLFEPSCLLPFADVNEGIKFFFMSLIGQLNDELDLGTSPSIFQHYLFLLLRLVNRKVEEALVRLNDSELKLRRLMVLINENYCEKRGTAFYAKELGLSGRQLNSLTHELVGKRCFEIVIMRRMVEADILLRTDMPIKEIAYRLGFGSVSHFDFFCNKEKGMSSAVWRGEHSLK